jgi:hypothetical protein
VRADDEKDRDRLRVNGKVASYAEARRPPGKPAPEIRVRANSTSYIEVWEYRVVWILAMHSIRELCTGGNDDFQQQSFQKANGYAWHRHRRSL